jgi:DNA polymerase III alpha subunit
MNYIPLNIKTNYSMLKSLIDIPKLINKCKSLGFNSIGITDENMFGVMEFYVLIMI